MSTRMWVCIVLVIIAMCVVFFVQKQENYDGNKSSCSQCNSDSLLPITDPEFNLRECAKQMILLEDHLFNPQKRCSDCIKKHCMTIEALAEEGASLDTKGDCYQECNDLAQTMRQIEKEYIEGRDPAEIAKELRQVRKPLMGKYFAYTKDE